MVFSSTVFLFFFLPLLLLFYLVVGKWARNLLLLGASLFFYAWGENIYVLLLLLSISMNYLFGVWMDHSRRNGKTGKLAFLTAITANLFLLGFFKYSSFLVENLNALFVAIALPTVHPPSTHLPIGISFFTFQALSYIIDLHRGHFGVEKNPLNLALYISLFPELIAGPIVRYHDIAAQIIQRTVSFDYFVRGVQRFILGLGKKVLIANVLGRTADYLFSLPPDSIPIGLAWLGAITYTLQIYFDFSGYSDMAIGLAMMFGFKLKENFNYPYISQSIREFWRRWHISLSTWFRDYLYIPLGGNRNGLFRTNLNLLIVFLCCGLWHGANWTFIIWGLFHGIFLALERFNPYARFFNNLPRLLRHAYTMVLVTIGWVVFRSESFSYAIAYVQAMFRFSTPPLYNSQIFLQINSEFWIVFALAILFSAPIFPSTIQVLHKWEQQTNKSIFLGVTLSSGSVVYSAFILLYSIASLMGGTHNPFLYFRF